MMWQEIKHGRLELGNPRHELLWLSVSYNLMSGTRSGNGLWTWQQVNMVEGGRKLWKDYKHNKKSKIHTDSKYNRTALMIAKHVKKEKEDNC